MLSTDSATSDLAQSMVSEMQGFFLRPSSRMARTASTIRAASVSLISGSLSLTMRNSRSRSG